MDFEANINSKNLTICIFWNYFLYTDNIYIWAAVQQRKSRAAFLLLLQLQAACILKQQVLKASGWDFCFCSTSEKPILAEWVGGLVSKQGLLRALSKHLPPLGVESNPFWAVSKHLPSSLNHSRANWAFATLSRISMAMKNQQREIQKTAPFNTMNSTMEAIWTEKCRLYVLWEMLHWVVAWSR